MHVLPNTQLTYYKKKKRYQSLCVCVYIYIYVLMYVLLIDYMPLTPAITILHIIQEPHLL